MSLLSNIVILIAFSIAVIDTLSKSQEKERKGISKYLISKKTTILLLGFLLAAQLFVNITGSQQTTTAFNNISITKDSVIKVQETLKSILDTLKSTIEQTNTEINLINDLNSDIEKTKEDISQSITEYQELNSNYKKQLEIERKKIIDSKPNLIINSTKNTYDTLNIKYHFEISNTGNRIADSVIYSSLMVLTDTNNSFKDVSVLKSNNDVHNNLSIPPNKAQIYHVNGPIAPLGDIEKYGLSFLLINIQYYDLMTKRKFINPTKIYTCNSLNDKSQYAFNTTKENVEKINSYLKRNHPSLYEIFK